MYFVMRPRAENGGFAVTSAYREVLFRFGSWCYGGSVQLTPLINLSDIPHVIPALRMQQSRLEFVYSADQVPATSPYTKPMAYMMKHAPLMEREIFTAEDVLSKLVERLAEMAWATPSRAGRGRLPRSFFEFQIAANDSEARVLRPVELIASSVLRQRRGARGHLLPGLLHCVVSEAGAEQPCSTRSSRTSSKGAFWSLLLGRVRGLAGLRKVSVWRSTSAMQAEMEVGCSASRTRRRRAARTRRWPSRGWRSSDGHSRGAGVGWRRRGRGGGRAGREEGG